MASADAARLGTSPLEGSHLRLEPLSMEHAEALFDELDPGCFEHLVSWPTEDRKEAFERWLRAGLMASGRIAFAVRTVEGGRVIGTTSYLDLREKDGGVEIGSTIYGRAYWGTVVNAQAKRLLMEHAFERCGFSRVQLKTSIHNAHSRKAISKLGAVFEGVLRGYQRRQDGTLRDTAMFSVLEGEWPKVKANLLGRERSDGRLALGALLASHTPADDKERDDLGRMRRAVQELSDPWSRREPTAHFTGSAVVVDEASTRVCLLHHGKLGRWLQPGGHCEPQDLQSLLATALREAREETGCTVRLHPRAPMPLDVDAHTIPARKTDPEHVHLDVRFLFRAIDPERLRHDPGESHGVKWLSFDEAVALADDPSLRRMLEKARRLV